MKSIIIKILVSISFLLLFEGCSNQVSKQKIWICGTALNSKVTTIPNTELEFLSITYPFFDSTLIEPKPLIGFDSLNALLKYPDLAKRAGVQGIVSCDVVFDTSGKVAKTILTRGIGAGCDEAVRDALVQIPFSPAIKNGKKTKITLKAFVVFRLYWNKK